MATTTNYGWTTPDDTALVKDGASAIRTLGTSVDTTTKNLNPSTTLGDIEYRSSTSNVNTRVGIGTSGQALTVVAGAPSWAASATSVLTTTGDSLYASAANTLARLGIGSTGQVLTVASGLPSWATPASAGMVLLSTTTLSGASTTISSISGSYKDLRIEIRGINVAAAAYPRIKPNGNDTICNTVVTGNDDNVGQDGNRYFGLSIRPTNNKDLTAGVTTNTFEITIENYASTVSNKNIIGTTWSKMTGREQAFVIVGAVATTSAITSLLFDLSASTYSGGTVLLYGVN